MKLKHYEQAMQGHKRCTSDGLGDHYYLEKINHMYNTGRNIDNGTQSRRDSTANDPFNGVKYHYSAAVSQLIRDLLQVDDRKRISARQVLEKYHDWFISHDAVIF